MHALKAEVSRDQRLVASWNAQDGAVIPNPEYRVFPANRASKPLEEFSFRNGHEKRVQATGAQRTGDPVKNY
jgi:hypothetical protein